MAFPVVEATAESSVNTAGTSHAVTLPAGIAASDLVLITMDIGSTSATLNALTGWTELLDEASANGLKILYYTGAGVPSDPTFTSSASTRSASIAWRISGVNKSITPQIGTTGTGTSASPDPPASAAPPSAKDYLFIAFAGMAGEEADDDTWGNTSPTNYTPSVPLQKACGTAGTNLGGLILAASRQLNTGSAEDPGAFGVDVSAAWRSQTITIHPIIATTATPPTLALTTSAFAPTVSTSANQKVTPPTLALTLTTFAPTVTGGAGTTVTPGTASLATATFAPAVGLAVIPSVRALTLNTFAPVVGVSVRVTPGAAGLTTSAFSPIISTPRTVTPEPAAMVTEAFAPSVNIAVRVTPDAIDLALTTFAPTASTPRLAIPETATLTLDSFAPSINVGALALVDPAALTLTMFGADVAATTNVLATPPTADLTLSAFAPDVMATGTRGEGGPGTAPPGGHAKRGRRVRRRILTARELVAMIDAGMFD